MKPVFLLFFLFLLDTSFAQTLQWSNSYEKAGSSSERKFIQCDAAGNIYSVKILYLDTLGHYIAKFDPSGVIQWQSLYTGVAWDKMSTDSAGNTYLIGRFYLNATVGSIVLTDTANHMVGFYAKYDVNGNCLWANKLGERTHLGDIYPLSSGEFYLGGHASVHPLYLANDTIPANHGFIAKVDSSGAFIWAKAIGTTGLGFLKVDASGNFYIAGNVYGTRAVGEGTSIIYISSNSWPNAFVAKFDSNLTAQWAKVGKTYGIYNPVSGLDLDSAGNAYVAGTLGFYMDFEGNVVSTSGENMYLVKYDPSGNYQWMKYSYSSSSGITLTDCFALMVDADGNSYVTGGTGNDTIHFDSYTLNGEMKPYLIKYDTNGNLLWGLNSEIQPVDIAGNGFGLCNDNFGNIYVAGNYGMWTDKTFLTKISESGLITEIQQIENITSLTVYPNPTGGLFQINYTSTEKANLHLVIINSLGQEVYSEQIFQFQGQYKKEIDISSHAKGIYAIQVSNGKVRQVKKLAVN